MDKTPGQQVRAWQLLYRQASESQISPPTRASYAPDAQHGNGRKSDGYLYAILIFLRESSSSLAMSLGNPLLVQLGSGNLFFLGITLSVASGLAGLRGWRRFMKSLLRISSLLGMALVLISAIPFPVWIYAVWLIFWLSPGVLGERRRSLKITATACFSIFSFVLCVQELTYHKAVEVRVARSKPVFVIGDSISAGLGRSERPWPAVLAEITGLKVFNLAQAGANVSDASFQVNGLDQPNALVLIEIGGNDLLGDSDAKTFQFKLEQLLTKIRATHTDIAMFELPLPPFKNSFGRAQRILAQKYNVRLIPKSCLASVLGMEGATSDGLHLTPVGHEALARSVAKILRTE